MSDRVESPSVRTPAGHARASIFIGVVPLVRAREPRAGELCVRGPDAHTLEGSARPLFHVEPSGRARPGPARWVPEHPRPLGVPAWLPPQPPATAREPG